MYDLDKVIEMAKHAGDLSYFLETPREDLIKFHSSFGRDIRNELKLWQRTWEPEIEGHCDYSPNHPDQVSMRLIEEAWDELNKV